MTLNLPHSLILTTLFESPEGDEKCNHNYRELILQILKKILPSDFFETKETAEAMYCHQKNILRQEIPLIKCSEVRHFPGNISFFALSKYRKDSFKFFFEMISRWLTPGSRLNVVLVYASDFRLTHLSEEVYTICEVMISIASRSEFEEIQRNFPITATEIGLGIHSEFYAHRILEIKGLSTDDKTALIQGFIAYLVKRFPHYYNTDVFTEMQHALVTYRDDFKACRQARHLSKIISIQYLFRKSLREAIKKKSNRRHLNLKIFRAAIRTSAGPKRILSFVVGINFLTDESFGEKHLLQAIQNYIPSAVGIGNSFFIHKDESEHISISYIEVEKKDGAEFTAAEIQNLKRELPPFLKSRIEHRLNNIFMPRNEEEVMRNILTLTNQIKYVRDIPQMLINFEEQAYAHLYFTVVLARLLRPDSVSIADLFKRANTFVEYLHDRTKLIGHVRKKYAKEATVFRLKLPKDRFLRADHSIDLYKARQTVVNELNKVIGEIRDYNGGMISKHNELLTEIRNSLKDVKDYDDLLLENFFYSLSPVIVRALVNFEAFKILFIMLLEGIKQYKQEGYYLRFKSDCYNVFALIVVEDLAMEDKIHCAIQDLQIPSAELAHAHVKTEGNTCIGYICCSHDLQKKEHFQQIIVQTLEGVAKA